MPQPRKKLLIDDPLLQVILPLGHGDFWGYISIGRIYGIRTNQLEQKCRVFKVGNVTPIRTECPFCLVPDPCDIQRDRFKEQLTYARSKEKAWHSWQFFIAFAVCHCRGSHCWLLGVLGGSTRTQFASAFACGTRRGVRLLAALDPGCLVAGASCCSINAELTSAELGSFITTFEGYHPHSSGKPNATTPQSHHFDGWYVCHPQMVGLLL